MNFRRAIVLTVFCLACGAILLRLVPNRPAALRPLAGADPELAAIGSSDGSPAGVVASGVPLSMRRLALRGWWVGGVCCTASHPGVRVMFFPAFSNAISTTTWPLKDAFWLTVAAAALCTTAWWIGVVKSPGRESPPQLA